MLSELRVMISFTMFWLFHISTTDWSHVETSEEHPERSSKLTIFGATNLIQTQLAIESAEKPSPAKGDDITLPINASYYHESSCKAPPQASLPRSKEDTQSIGVSHHLETSNKPAISTPQYPENKENEGGPVMASDNILSMGKNITRYIR